MKTFSRLVGAAAVVVVLGGSTPALAVSGEGERAKGPKPGVLQPPGPRRIDRQRRP